MGYGRERRSMHTQASKGDLFILSLTRRKALSSQHTSFVCLWVVRPECRERGGRPEGGGRSFCQMNDKAKRKSRGTRHRQRQSGVITSNKYHRAPNLAANSSNSA
eukprot:scaffold44334_cov57-Phaeocystis_antarctica.AAC.3